MKFFTLLTIFTISATVFGDCKITLSENGFIKVNGVNIASYALPIMLHSLEITNADIKLWKKSDIAILIVAEGYGDFLPFLKKNGIRVQALDLWYGLTDTLPPGRHSYYMKKFVRLNKEALLTGSALEIPLPSNSVSVLLNHKLVNNLQLDEILKFIPEIVRVLRVGGEARVASFQAPHINYVTALLTTDFQKKTQFEFHGSTLFLKKIK